MPAEPKDAEQAGCDRRGLGNDNRASQLEVVELGESKVCCSGSPSEEESKREIWSVISSGRDDETFDCSLIDHKRRRAEGGPRTPSVNAELNRYVSETTDAGLAREAQGHVRK